MPSTRLNDSYTAFDATERAHWIEPLLDGTRVLIRALQAEDRQREEEFINGLSADARYFRFLGEFKTASKQLIDQMMNVDNRHRMAYIALVHENGKLREVGVSRYGATGDGGRCECAVVVSDQWRHRGLAVLLMRHLIDIGRQNGYTRMVSIDSAENEAMRALCHYLGFSRRLDPGDAAQVIHTLDL